MIVNAVCPHCRKSLRIDPAAIMGSQAKTMTDKAIAQRSNAAKSRWAKVREAKEKEAIPKKKI